MTQHHRVLNCRRDPDHHQLPLHAAHLAPAASLPPGTNNRANTVPVRDQKTLGSCTAFMGMGNLQHTLYREGKDPGELSEMLLYQLELMAQGQFGHDMGSTVSTAMSTLIKRGYALAREYPYVLSNFRRRPSHALINAAAARKLPTADVHRVLQDLPGLKSILFAGRMVGFAADLPESFLSDEVAKTGIWDGPQANDPIAGGHAINIIDYDDTAFDGEGGFWVRNSWGTEWGQAGYVLVRYSWFLSSAVSDLATVVVA